MRNKRSWPCATIPLLPFVTGAVAADETAVGIVALMSGPFAESG